MQNIIFERNELLAKKVIDNLTKRNFEAYYSKNKNEANLKILELIEKQETISWGGSVTLDELGIKDILKSKNYTTIDRQSAKTPQEREEIIRKSIFADVFMMSANAISQEGEIVNIDGVGNRISALCFGPKKIIMVIGMNKITRTLDEAISRARNYAAPINAKRVSNFFEIKTPCKETGYCADCKSKSSICSNILITRLSYPQNRIKVILVNENIGY